MRAQGSTQVMADTRDLMQGCALQLEHHRLTFDVFVRCRCVFSLNRICCGMELGGAGIACPYRGDLEVLDVDNTDLATDDIQVCLCAPLKLTAIREYVTFSFSTILVRAYRINLMCKVHMPSATLKSVSGPPDKTIIKKLRGLITRAAPEVFRPVFIELETLMKREFL